MSEDQIYNPPPPEVREDMKRRLAIHGVQKLEMAFELNERLYQLESEREVRSSHGPSNFLEAELEELLRVINHELIPLKTALEMRSCFWSVYADNVLQCELTPLHIPRCHADSSRERLGTVASSTDSSTGDPDFGHVPFLYHVRKLLYYAMAYEWKVAYQPLMRTVLPVGTQLMNDLQFYMMQEDVKLVPPASVIVETVGNWLNEVRQFQAALDIGAGLPSMLLFILDYFRYTPPPFTVIQYSADHPFLFTLVPSRTYIKRFGDGAIAASSYERITLPPFIPIHRLLAPYITKNLPPPENQPTTPIGVIRRGLGSVLGFLSDPRANGKEGSDSVSWQGNEANGEESTVKRLTLDGIRVIRALGIQGIIPPFYTFCVPRHENIFLRFPDLSGTSLSLGHSAYAGAVYTGTHRFEEKSEANAPHKSGNVPSPSIPTCESLRDNR